MAKNKYDVGFDDYEEREGSGYDGDEPKKGTYEGKLVSLREHTTSDTALEWQFEITEEPYVGWRGWTYSDMENAKWKTQQYVKAITGGKEENFSLKPVEAGGTGSESATVAKAKPVLIRIRREMYDDEPKARIQRIMPMEGATEKKGKKKKKDEDPF